MRVLDGDTIEVTARIWLGQAITTVVRISGIDSPEIRGKCDSERRLAQEAREFITKRIGNGTVVLRQIRFGKYGGRVLAEVEDSDGNDISQIMIAAGLARPYAGRGPKAWCASG